MIRTLVCALAFLASLAACSTQGPADVTVPAPTGVMEQDRATVQSVLDAVRPGQTVAFAAGRYVLGAGVRLTVPDVTLRGHPDGTVLRGCEPDAFDVTQAEFLSPVINCAGFYIQAERQTVRDLTFEYMWHGILIGPYPTSVEEAARTQGVLPPIPVGGQRIEGNTFRATPNGMRVLGIGDSVSVVRDNDFIDTFHAIGIYGPPVHFVGNRIRVENALGVPTSRVPGSAILVSAQDTDCRGHLVADNSVEGHPGAIYVMVTRGRVCRGVQVRSNTVRVARVALPADGWVIPRSSTDSTLVGAPITVSRSDDVSPGVAANAPAGILEDIVVEGNTIHGGDGIGIVVNADRTRIIDNRISDIRIRAPFPGINWDVSLVTWVQGNGSGVWLAPAARENEIRGNVFARIAGPAITVEGSANRVWLRASGDAVLDIGRENVVERTP
jgi:hypothetical protein